MRLLFVWLGMLTLVGSVEFSEGATVSWTGGAGNNLWNAPANWNGGALPGPGDDVVITGSGEVAFGTGNSTIRSLQSARDFTLTNGSLTLSGGASAIQGALSLKGGFLTVRGAGTVFTANGSTSLEGTVLSANQGATISLPNLTSAIRPSQGYITISATDPGSQVNLPNLTAAGVNDFYQFELQVDGGGKIAAPKLTQIQGAIDALADGANSMIDISGLQGSLRRTNPGNAYLEARDGATILIPGVTELDGVNLTLRGAARVPTAQLGSFKQANLLLDGVTNNFPALTNIFGSNISLTRGGRATLPGFTTWSETNNENLNCTATGVGSVLELPNLTETSVRDFYQVELLAYDGGEIRLPKLAKISGAIDTLASGNGAKVILTGFAGAFTNSSSGSAYIEARDGGTISMPGVTSFDHVHLIVRTTGDVSTAQLKGITEGDIRMDARAGNFAALTDLTGSSLYTQNGGTLTLPGITQVSRNVNGSLHFEASDAGSRIALANLTAASVRDFYQVELFAYNGGQIDLPKLASITGAIDALSDGTGSLVNLPALPSRFSNTSSGAAYIEGRNGGTVSFPAVTELNAVTLTIRNNSPITVSQLTAITEGEFDLDATTLNLPGLVGLNGTGIKLQNGANLLLSGVTQVARTNNGNISYTVNNPGTALALPNLATAATKDFYQLALSATDGGRISLPNLSQLNTALNAYAEDTNSVIDLPGLAGNLINATDGAAYIEARDGGAVLVPNVTGLDKFNLRIRTTGMVPTAQLVSIRNSDVILDGAAVPFPLLADTTGTKFNYINGGTASFSAPSDLIVSDIRVPATALAATPVQIIWELTNLGTPATNAIWSDSLYASSDNTIGNDEMMNSFQGTGNFGQGQKRLFTNNIVFLPRQAGPQYIVIAANATRTLFEGTNYANNTNISATGIKVLAPDLIAQAPSVQPTSTQFGQTVTVGWTVKNNGTTSTPANWIDRVLLVTGTNALGSGTVLLNRATTSSLAPGASYSRSENVTIPILATLNDGNYYLAILVDEQGAVAESVETNNIVFVPITLARPPLPDLAVDQIASPATALPGQSLQITWAVTNKGTAVANGAWTETVALITTNGVVTNQVLGTFDFTNTIAVNDSIVRTQQVTLPPDVRAGNARFSLSVDSANEIAEKNETNNTSLSTQAIAIQPILSLQLPVTNISELAANPRISALLTRNGDLSVPLTVTIASSDTTGLIVPATVTFRAGDSSALVDLVAQHDGIPDPDREVIVTATVAGYNSASAKVLVQNADIPKLILKSTSASLNEGQSIQVTLSHDAISAGSITVNLVASGSGQLTLPESVIIPAGQTLVVFQATAADDSRLEPDHSYTISASANGFTSGSISILIHDNDLPEFTFVVANTNFSENAGPNATTATISRGAISPRSLDIEFENSNPQAALVPDRATIPAGQESVSFPIGAVDNTQVDGAKTVVLKAFALGTTSGERVAQAGPVTLTISDDDGPSLTLALSKDLAGEGASPAATATVSRNTATTQPLAVSLSSSLPNFASLPATVTIPAGQTSVSVPLTTFDDHVDNGNKTVQFTASAAGFTSGSASIIVTDIRRPDLIPTDVAGPDTAETEAFINVAYRIVNQGLAPAGTNWVTRIFLSDDAVVGNDTLLTDYTFNGTLPPGQFFAQSRQVRIPQQPGNYWVVVETDSDGQIDEILENNNVSISAQPIRVDAAYRATVIADVKSAPAGTTIPMHGTAVKTSTGGPAAFALVNIHINVRGTKRVISALADESGNFHLIFTPLPGEAGLYEIGAAHPGAADAPIQDSFTLYGLKTEAIDPIHLPEGSSITGQVQLQNPGDIPLTALSIVVSNKPANLDITTSAPTNSNIPALGSVTAGFAITARDASVPQSTVILHVTTAEGAKLDVPITITVDTLRPHLVAVPAELVRGMKVGAQTFAEFDVVNDGGAASGPVNISLPAVDWMHLVSPSPITSIAPGASNHVTLQLTPAAGMQLGNYDGTIAINYSNTFANLPFTFRALSEAKGDLLITAVDEYTYFAEGSPKVSGAAVTILDAVTEQPVTNGVTDSAGQLFVPNLPEGYYELQVKADKHTSFRDTTLLISGKTNQVQTFLRREAVRYIWTVVPTEIEDRTRITIVTEFEAFVPMPVVTMDPPLIDLADFTAEVTQIDLRIENHGLITAKEAKLHYGEHPDWSFEPLITDLGDLPARSSLTVPMIIRRKHGAAPLRNLSNLSVLSAGTIHAMGGGGGCSVAGSCEFVVECGGSKLGGSADQPIINASASGNCGGGGGGGGGSAGGGGSSGGGAGGGGPASSSASLASCSPCLLSLFQCALNFALPPLASCFNDAASCASGGGAYDCAKAGLSCAGAAGHEIPGIGTAINIYDCLNGIVPSCLGGGGGGGGSGGGTGGGTGGSTSGFGAQSLFAESLARQGFRATALTAQAESGSSQVDFAPFAFIRQRITRALKAVDPLRYVLGNDAWFFDPSTNAVSNWLQAVLLRIDIGSDGGKKISTAEAAQLLALPLPKTVNSQIASAFIARWNRSIDYWAAGILNLVDVPAGQSTDFIAQDVLAALSTEATYAFRDTTADGYPDPFSAMNSARDELIKWASEGEKNGVCAHVRLQLDQQAVMTRDAFNARLQIINDSGTPLQNISLDVVVRRRNGEDASAFFAIKPPTLTGINAIDGTGTIPPGTNGTASFILVPTTDAALTGPEEFLVGGTLRYKQDQLNLTVPLAPSSITVLPSPSLKVKYFHQRDVFADDPFTPQIEPSIPFSLAVMVQNNGHGAARNVRIDSAQPKIVDNEKGLLADFKIIATEVAGQNLQPSLTVNFGEIDPGTNAIGRWLLTSTILGGFIDYSATFEHLDGLGNKKLSLIEGIEIHELIHIVRATGTNDDGRPDFLVNDIPDLYSRPDTLHLSDGTVKPVSVVLEGTTDRAPVGTNLQVHLTASMPQGWTYVRVSDPGNGKFLLTKVVRDDGFEVPFGDNVWTTDRTFLGNARRPLVENMIHLFDYNSSGHYTLFYTPAPAGDTIAPTSAVLPLPADSTARIPVSWSGQDNAGGSGISFYDIYVAVDNGPFQVWIEGTLDRSAIYQGGFGRSYSFYSVATDQAGNREAPHAVADAHTTVTRTNHPPTLDVIADRVIKEGQTLDIQPVATDIDGDELLFSLSTNAPPGVVLNPFSGRITWQTTGNSGPATYPFTLQVLDNGSPRLGVTRTFKVSVSDENSAPVITPIADRTINEGQLLSFSAQANDFDIPAQAITFSLAPGAPTGVTVDSTGLFEWRPADYQGGITYSLGVIATDNGVPSLSSTQTFKITVRDTRSDLVLAGGVTNVLAGGSITVPLVLTSGPDVNDITFDLRADDPHLATVALDSVAPEILSVSLEPVADGHLGHFRGHFELDTSRATVGARTVGQLRFTTILGAHSSVADLQISSLQATRQVGQTGQTSETIAQTSARAGRLFLIQEEPLIDIYLSSKTEATLVLYAKPGAQCVLQSQTLLGSGQWTDSAGMQFINAWQPMLWPIAQGQQTYFRIKRTN